MTGHTDHDWPQTFPYTNGDALIDRVRNGWRLSLGAQVVEAPTLVDAFEALTDHRVGIDELRVVLAALARDKAFGDRMRRSAGIDES
jgi:hypothetical protein